MKPQKEIEELKKRIRKLEEKVKEINELECPYEIKIRKGFKSKRRTAL